MSTPAENIDPGGAGSPNTSLSPEDSWITEFRIDDPIDVPEAPLPTDSAAGAGESAAAAGAEKTPDPSTEGAPEKTPVPTDEGADKAPVIEAKPDAAPEAGKEKPVDAAPVLTEPELSPAENDLINTLPEAQRPEAADKFKRSFFMAHYLNPDKPASEIRQHLADRSPSRYAELETEVLTNKLATPNVFAADLFQRAPETYQKLAMEVYNGDPSFFAKQVTGREGLTPEQIQTAIDFHDRHKDEFTDDEQLSELDEDTLAEIETYFPDQAPMIKRQLEAAKKNADELASLKAAQAKEKPAEDPKTAEAAQAATVQKEVDDLWNLGRDTVGDYVATKAFDPTKGVGIHVTPEERKAAPFVALLKDFKASVLFQGLDIDGKPVLEGFQKSLIDWGENKPEFKDKLLHMSKFTEAREKQNVLEVANGMLPFAETYYQERLKHPVFAQIDALINLVTEKGWTAPKFDKQVPGQLPAKDSGASKAAAPDDWLIADAVGRAG